MRWTRRVCVGVVPLLVLLLVPCGAAGDPFVVHMLVPGFVVQELPVQLTNINNLEYMPDGRLLAVGYDGRVHILTDTDGDGLEDKSAIWWQNDKDPFRGPIGSLLTPEGLYVPSKGRLTLLTDTDNDGRADKEEIVAIGWKEIFQAVDCLGVAKDKEGNIYFGLGCTNFADAYLLDKEGKSHYDVNSERGTILKLSPDRKKREILATGVRFSVGIDINRHGDLFWTDQEGDTWTKGNHLDELNVLLPGRRHYGFPERHPTYLPGTNDEPPVTSFGPQHQSACDLIFNEPAERQPRFGPAIWENDALVTGESRGKLWRAPLAKVEHGYVGFRPHAFARLDMLTVGHTISPQGDLVVCVHSGPPDWGTGPKGPGKIFKIIYADKNAPQPVAAWPSSRDEVRIAFDRPVDPSITSRLAGITLDAGEHVRAADRFEVLKPPYEVVKEQLAAGWKNVKINGATLSNDARTLILKTEQLPWRAWYAAGIPGLLAPGSSGLGETIDLDFDLAGLDAQWQSDDGKSQWSGWLPHPDPAVIAALLRGSAEHEALLSHLKQPGRLVMKSRLQLSGKTATVHLTSSSGNLTLSTWNSEKSETRRRTDDGSVERRRSNSSRSIAKVEQSEGDADVTQGIDLNNGSANFELSLRTGDRPLVLSISYHTDLDPTERPLPVEAFVLPWAPDERQPMKPKAESPLTAGGNWEAGKALYFGEAKCSTCHTIRDEGGRIGPNLSNLVHLDPESVLKHIIEPNATINPDHVNYNVKLKNGDQLSGLVYNEGPDHYRVIESFEKSTLVKKSDVATLKPLDISIMPEGYKDLGEQKLKDLLTYLTKEK